MLRVTPPALTIRPSASARLSCTLLALLPLLGGCAVDRTGMLWARVVPADRAWVLQVHAPGAYLQTDNPGDAGLTIGYARRAYVFSADEVPMPAEGWHLFRLPHVAAREALAIHARSIGAEVRFGPAEPGFTLGVRSVTASRGPEPGPDSFRLLIFHLDAPGQTCYRTREVSPC